MPTTHSEAKEKVLFVITKANWGGAQRYVYDLAVGLREEYEVVVAFGEEGAVLEERLGIEGIRTERVPALKNTTSLVAIMRCARVLARLCREEYPDIVHVNSSVAGLAGALGARVAGVPHIVFTAHGWAFNEDRPYLARLAIKALHWLTVLIAHQTIAVSEAMKQQMNWPLAARKIAVVHNGIAPLVLLNRAEARSKLAERVSALRLYTEDTWTGTIAELHPVKRHDLMLDALALIVREHPTLRHIIIGDGALADTLAERVRELGLTEHVFFAGHVPDAARYLRALDLFTLTSRSEALAYVLLEVSHAGLPVIATRVGGIPEVITDGVTGVLVPPGDAEALAGALTQLLDNSERRAEYASALHKEAGRRFSLETMLEETRALYRRLTER